MKDLNGLNQYRLPEMERRLYGASFDTGFGAGNGIFKVFVKGKSFKVIASDVADNICII